MAGELNYRQRSSLGRLLAERRAALGISLREAARRSGVDPHTYMDLERGEQAAPRMIQLSGIAEGLGVPMSDVLTAAGWLPGGELPSLQPYLRTKYRDLPESALADVESYFDKIAAEHRISAGPDDDEDERSE